MWNIHNTSYTTSDTLCTIYNTNGMTKYRKGPTKDRKGPTKEHYTGPQRIGNTIKDPKGLPWRITQGPDLQNILRQSYDYLMIMP